MLSLPLGLVKAKADSIAGISLMLKPTEELSGNLFLCAAAGKKQAPKLAGQALAFTTSFRCSLL